MTRALAVLAFLLAAPAFAQPVASEAQCRWLADQVGFAADLRDQGYGPADVAPGLSQAGLDDDAVQIVLGWAFDGNDTNPADLAEAFMQQCMTGFN